MHVWIAGLRTKEESKNLLFSIFDNVVVNDTEVSKYRDVYRLSNGIAHCSCKTFDSQDTCKMCVKEYVT